MTKYKQESNVFIVKPNIKIPILFNNICETKLILFQDLILNIKNFMKKEVNLKIEILLKIKKNKTKIKAQMNELIYKDKNLKVLIQKLILS